MSVNYKKTSTDSDRLISSAIWADCPIIGLQTHQRDGLYKYDDFDAGMMEASSVPTTRYDHYIDTGGTILQVAGVNGQMALLSDGTAADAVYMNETAANFNISDTAGAKFNLWFEARVKISVLTATVPSLFIGLAEKIAVGSEATASYQAVTTGAVTDAISAIGFNVKTDATSEIDYGYGSTTGGQVWTVLKAAAGTIVADTYIKLGFKVDWEATPSQRIKFYINGVEQSTYVTDTLIEAAAFPDAEDMCMVIGAKTGAGAATFTNSIDWWTCAQVYDRNTID